MPSIVSKLMRKRGRGRRRGPDGKQFALTDAGVRLLAVKDYDAIFMARIAREAGCSVGALYARYPEKNAYLYHVIAASFRSMTDSAATELEARRWRHLRLPYVAAHIVEYIIASMTTPRAAGVIRATMKLSTVRPITIELFDDYRTAVAKLAADALAPRLRGNRSGAIRIGMQVVFGVVTDAVLQPRPGPMAAGSKRMKAALVQLMLGYLGLSKDSTWSGEETEGEDDHDDDKLDVVEEPRAPDAGSLVFDPDLRVMRKDKARKGDTKQPQVVAGKDTTNRRNRPSRSPSADEPSQPTAVVKPAKVRKPEAEPASPRRKHRPI